MITWGYEKEKYLLLKNENISEYASLGMICLCYWSHRNAYSLWFSCFFYTKFSHI